jgi:hypothetical protein
MLLSVRLAEIVFSILIFIFAIWTILTQGALLFGFSFLTLSKLFSLVIIFLSFIILLVKRKRSHNRPPLVPDYTTIIMLLLLVIIGASLALFSNRPNADDVNYTSNAVYYLKHINEPLETVLHNHALTNFSFHQPLLLCWTLEFFWAYLSLIFNQNFLDIYYILVPLGGGALIPLVWYLLLSKFSGDSLYTVYTVLGVTMICAFLSVDGGAHRSFGNFAFVRIWQGKVILMSILIPLLTAYSLDFFRKKDLYSWSRLILASTAAVGFSSSALFLVPFLGILLSAGYFISYADKKKLKLLAVYYSGFLYLGLISLYLFLKVKPSSMDYLGFEGWPTTDFGGQHQLVFGGWFSYSSIFFYLSLLLSLILLGSSLKKFLLGWLVFAFIFFLNPIMMPVIAKYFTTNNAYWRLFYLLPFPMLLGVLVISVFENRKLSARYSCGDGNKFYPQPFCRFQ